MMKAMTLHSLLAILFSNFLFSYVLSNISTIESKVPVIFGQNGTLTLSLNQNWKYYELLKREDTWQKALREGQEFVDKLNDVREQSPWSTVDELKVHLNPMPKHQGKATVSAPGCMFADTNTIRQTVGRFRLQTLIQ